MPEADVLELSERRSLRDPPPDRGRLMDSEEVAEEILGGARTERWVRRNVPHKMRLGYSTVRWWEADVMKWLDSLREET